MPAGAAPVLIGTSLSISIGKFNLIIFLTTLLCSLLIQIITNFFNEYYDYKRGADTEDRLGPDRAVSKGLIKPRTMKNVAVSLTVLTFTLGLYLVYIGGMPILIIGIASLLCAYLYTGGPKPIAYLGLSEIFVLVFFGVVPVTGTFYLQTGFVNATCFIASLAPGFFSMNILGVNNIRDIETDKKVNKRTFAMMIGENNSKIFFSVLNFLAFLIPVILYISGENKYVLLPLVMFPVAIILNIKLFFKQGKELNIILSGTGKILLIYSLLISTGLIL